MWTHTVPPSTSPSCPGPYRPIHADELCFACWRLWKFSGADTHPAELDPRDQVKDLEHVTLTQGAAVLVDLIGVTILIVDPDQAAGVMIALSGRLNGMKARHLTNYLMPPGTAGELVRDITAAVIATNTPSVMEAFNDGVRGKAA